MMEGLVEEDQTVKAPSGWTVSWCVIVDELMTAGQ